MKKYIERLGKINVELSQKANKLKEECSRKEIDQKHQLVRKDQELIDQLRKKDQEIKNLRDRMKKHNEDQVELKKELESTKTQLKSTYDALQSCDRRADIVKGMMENLEKELEELKRAQINETTPVATHEKPGSDRREGIKATAPVEINLQKTPVAILEKPGPDRGEEYGLREA